MTSTTPYKLLHPVQHGSQLIEQVDIQRVKGKHLKNIDPQSFVGNLTLVSRVTNQPTSVIEEMDMADLNNIKDILDGFLADTPQTGN